MYPTSSLLGLEKTQIVTTEGWCWEEADFAVKCTFAFSVYWSFHSCAAYIIFRLFLGRCADLHGQSMWHYLHHCVQPVLFLEFFVGNFKFAEAYEQNPLRGSQQSYSCFKILLWLLNNSQRLWSHLPWCFRVQYVFILLPHWVRKFPIHWVWPHFVKWAMTWFCGVKATQ